MQRNDLTKLAAAYTRVITETHDTGSTEQPTLTEQEGGALTPEFDAKFDAVVQALKQLKSFCVANEDQLEPFQTWELVVDNLVQELQFSADTGPSDI